MRIGIAARDLARSGCGVGTYISNIVDHVVRQDQKNEYVIFYQNRDSMDPAAGVPAQHLDSNNKIIWDYALLPQAVKKYKLDLLFCPKNVLPFGIKCKSIITIHDLAYYDQSLNAYKWLDTLYMRRMIRSSAERANGIIAVSENTKLDILRTLDPPKATGIKVIHEAASEAFRVLEDEAALAQCRKKYALDGPFFFYAGSISPRKNLARTVRAFARIAGHIPHKFVITGGRRWRDADFFDAVGRSGVADRIKILGHVNQEEIVNRYNLADFSIYPSLYEGFGLPIIEAMSCGAPVACANNTSLPEVAGDAALLFDALDEDSIANAILRLAQDEKLRGRYATKSLDQAKKFSWQRTAEETIAFFNAIGARTP
jgi:glycosyltransferase involved in cell wall biosynthesis